MPALTKDTVSIDTKLRSLNQRQLVVFDFDDTLVDCNSDTWIHQLAPTKRVPEEIQWKPGQDYFRHVQTVVDHLRAQGVTEQDFVACLGDMPEVPGMIEVLVKTLGSQPDKYDIVILSDSNSFFIGSFLKSRSIEKYIHTVLTNQARFKPDGRLEITEFHLQDYCPISARNLCKGRALKNFIGQQMLDHNTVYTCINYVGDGENDFCPSSKLSALDRVFPRAGYSLDRLINKLRDNENIRANEDSRLPEIKATIFPWRSGDEILKVITDSH